MLSKSDQAILNTKMNVASFTTQSGTKLHRTLNCVNARYDFSVHGGAVGTINLDDEDGNNIVLPSGAIIWDGVIDILTGMTSTGNNGTIALDSNAAGDLKAAVDADTLSGRVATIPVGTAAASIKLTADRTLTVTIATNPLLTGKFDLYLFYMFPQS